MADPDSPDERSTLARRWRRLGSVRVRTTVAAVVVVGVALAVGSVVLVGTLRTALTDDARSVSTLRAQELAQQIEAGDVPPLLIAEADEQYIQLIDPAGDVVASSANVAGLPVLARPQPGETLVFEPPIGDDDFVAASAIADTSEGALLVVFARSLDEVVDSAEALSGLLGVAVPLLLVLVGATTWFVVGRALAPVEAIRNEVEQISTEALDRRVPQPTADDEIARLASTMNRMLSRLEDGHARQQRFVADASHELRSPTAAMRQHAEVASSHPDRSSLAQLSDVVLAETGRIQRLVDDLLLLARADERGPELARRPVDVDDAVFAEAGRLRTQTTKRIDTHQVSAGRIVGDEAAVRRILRNLGDNAERHAAEVVTFALAERDRTVELTVDDDGPGIDVADRERVFERFARLDEARARDGGGTGLGLAIVRELVEAHGGTVEVLDSPLGGARFRVRVPAAVG